MPSGLTGNPHEHSASCSAAGDYRPASANDCLHHSTDLALWCCECAVPLAAHPGYRWAGKLGHTTSLQLVAGWVCGFLLGLPDFGATIKQCLLHSAEDMVVAGACCSAPVPAAGLQFGCWHPCNACACISRYESEQVPQGAGALSVTACGWLGLWLPTRLAWSWRHNQAMFAALS